MPVDRVFIDRASAKDVNRPQLQAMVDFVREGDVIVVHSMDRLARNLEDLRDIVNKQTDRGIRVEFVKEGLTFSGDDSPMARLMLNVMGSFAQFERELLKERQREGITQAKKRGVYRGSKPKLSGEQILALKKRVDADGNKSKIAREFGISRDTLYQYLRQAAG